MRWPRDRRGLERRGGHGVIFCSPQQLLSTMRWPHGPAAVVGSAAEKADDRFLIEFAARLGALSSTVDGPTQATISRWVSEAAAQFRHAPTRPMSPSWSSASCAQGWPQPRRDRGGIRFVDLVQRLGEPHARCRRRSGRGRRVRPNKGPAAPGPTCVGRRTARTVTRQRRAAHGVPPDVVVPVDPEVSAPGYRGRWALTLGAGGRPRWGDADGPSGADEEPP